MFPLSARICQLVSMTALLGACAQTPAPYPSTGIEKGGDTQTPPLAALSSVKEPDAREVVIVINANSYGGAHAGMFAGGRLYDPSGTYVGFRSEDSAWRYPTLRDYLSFQMRDGPNVRVYRYLLAEADFKVIQSRIEHAGWGMPMFCAANVQTALAGIGPFKNLQSNWWISPETLGSRLDGMGKSTAVSRPCDALDSQNC